MSASKVTLKSTGEKVFPLVKYEGSPLNPSQGYTDVVIPRPGMKRKKSVIQRVKNGNLKKV